VVMTGAAAVSSSLESRLQGRRRALVIGVGGGGDVVGALPTARFLELLGIDTVLGGLAWERFVHDPRPGTRTLAEVRGVEALAATVWLAGADTETVDGVRFAESEAAAALGRRTVLIDLSQGALGATEGLRAALSALSADLLVGVDVGGDSLARGGEPGLRSPLADSMMLAAIDSLAGEVTTLWGVIGYGSDGELTPAEIDRALAELAGSGALLGAWGVTPEVAAELERLVDRIPTEASRVVLECARGALGGRAIRDGTRPVPLSPVCTVTFYLDPVALAARTPLAAAVRHSRSLDAANEALLALGVRSEYEFEKEMARRGERQYPRDS